MTCKTTNLFVYHTQSALGGNILKSLYNRAVVVKKVFPSELLQTRMVPGDKDLGISSFSLLDNHSTIPANRFPEPTDTTGNNAESIYHIFLN
jgi:hypothetical protein